MIEIKDLTFGYSKESSPVLKGITLSIPSGQWVAVIGANGSGKSTLARCINGLLQPQNGSVTVDGFSIKKEDELMQVRQKVAFVFQNPDNQLVAATVEDDVAFGPENLGLPREEITRRVDEALHITKLTEKREMPPYSLSGGEKQRVAIAGGIAMASRYLILDEPTSMLDPLMREQVLESICLLHREHGMGVVYVTNNMQEVLLADRVIMLADGKLVQDGTPTQVFSVPAFLESHGLALPSVCKICTMLAQDGFAAVRGVFSVEELVERLCEFN